MPERPAVPGCAVAKLRLDNRCLGEEGLANCHFLQCVLQENGVILLLRLTTKSGHFKVKVNFIIPGNSCGGYTSP